MKIKKITEEACKTTRSLWEEVFPEDSVQFTDYYFAHKAKKNIGYVLGEEPYHAMMFRTPYDLCIGNQQREISYLVGVATRKECRHRGYMRSLLMHSFQEMYEEKQPFTFLMPANSAIYEPFDFRYIYERDVWKLKEDIVTETSKLNGLHSVSTLQKQFADVPILEMLAEFANDYLKKHYNVYVHRDVSYYEMQLKESQAQNGDIYVWLEQGVIQACFLYAKEDGEVFIQEVMERKEGILNFLEKEKKKKPIIMARVIHLEEMMKLVCCKKPQNIFLEIEDDLILENTGIYRWEITETGSMVTKISSGCRKRSEVGTGTEDNRDESNVKKISMHVRDFTPWVLRDVFINEIV